MLCSQTWLPTVQEVLQADWQEAGHSPQPPVRRVFFSIALLTVVVCFLIVNPSSYYNRLPILFYLVFRLFASSFCKLTKLHIFNDLFKVLLLIFCYNDTKNYFREAYNEVQTHYYLLAFCNLFNLRIIRQGA